MDAAAHMAAEQTAEAPEQVVQQPAPRPTFEEELAFCCAYATGLLQGVEDPAVQSSLPLHPANVSEACSNGYILWCATLLLMPHCTLRAPGCGTPLRLAENILATP